MRFEDKKNPCREINRPEWVGRFISRIYKNAKNTGEKCVLKTRKRFISRIYKIPKTRVKNAF